MTIPPPYTINNKILTLIAQIETNRADLQNTPLPDQLITNLTRQTLLKSSVFSAQIEGNPLSLNDLDTSSPPNEGRLEEIKPETQIQQAKSQEQSYHHQEIENIITALSYLRDKTIPQIIDLPFILQLHCLIMHKLIHPSQAGLLRKEPSAIFDTSGNVVYMTPPPSELNSLLSSLLALINNENSIFPLIKASLAHLTFEKIHPFLDGNGRVGRLIFQAILAKHNYHFNWLLSIEELLQQKKSTYYALLDQPDATEFIEFILQNILEETIRIKTTIKEKSQLKNENLEIELLLPRRKEILQIITDQKLISFNQIQRRFLKIPPRTLRYDLQQLEKQNLIQKLGSTRGAMYQKKIILVSTTQTY